MTSSPCLSPQQRLDKSRQAIVGDMSHDDSETHEPDHDRRAGDQAIDTSTGTWHVIKQLTASWWQAHPAHLALDIVTPMLRTYAEEKPLKLLGISAGIGAAAVVLRPWRLISLTGLLLATLKSSEMSGVMGSLLSADRKQARPP